MVPSTPVLAPPSPLLPSFYHHDRAWRLILCLEHGVYLPHSRASKHIHSAHTGLHLIQPYATVDILRYIDGLDLIAAIEDWTPPIDPIAPIPALGQPFAGHLCLAPGCQFRCKHRKGMNRHLRVEHGWDALNKRRGHADRRPAQVAPMQYLFGRSNPVSQGFIRVHYPYSLYERASGLRGHEQGSIWPPCGSQSILIQSPSILPPSTPPAPASLLNWSSPHGDPANLDPQVYPDQTDSWMQRTGWQELFGGRCRRWIHQSSLRPGIPPGVMVFDQDLTTATQGRPALSTRRTEKVCSVIEAHATALIQAAIDNVHTSSWRARVKLVSFTSTAARRRAFQPLKRVNSEKKYSQIWQRLLLCLIRVSRHRQQYQQQCWGLSLPEEVQNACDQAYSQALKILDLQKRHRRSRTANIDEALDHSYVEDQLQQTLSDLSYALVAPSRRERAMTQYPVVYFAGILGLTSTGTFLRARDYTTHLAALVWISRAVFLFRWLPPSFRPLSPVQHRSGRNEASVTPAASVGSESENNESRSAPYNGDQANTDVDEVDHYFNSDGEGSYSSNEDRADDSDSSLGGRQYKTPVSGQRRWDSQAQDDSYFEKLDRFCQQQEEYLLFHSDYPFSELVCLLAMGLRIGARQPGPSKVFWSENKQTLRLSGHGHSFTMDQFRAFAQQSLTHAVKALNALLGGMTDHTKLNGLHDNLADPRYGYSVASSLDQDRPMEIFLEHLQNKSDRDRNGPFRDEKGHWQRKRIMVYLNQCTVAMQLALVAVHIWGGQPGRGPEISATKYRQGRNSPRNVFWTLDQLMIHQPYNKSAAITEDQNGTSYFLPDQLSLALVRFLLYVRPALSYLCSQTQVPFQSSDYLFRSYMPNAAARKAIRWTSPHLTRLLRSASGPFKLDFTLQSYRQAAVAIAHTHLASNPTPTALARAERIRLFDQQAGHNKRAKTFNYNQNGDYPTGMQPSDLMNAASLTREWHRWLGAEPTCLASTSTDQRRSPLWTPVKRPFRPSQPQKPSLTPEQPPSSPSEAFHTPPESFHTPPESFRTPPPFSQSPPPRSCSTQPPSSLPSLDQMLGRPLSAPISPSARPHSQRPPRSRIHLTPPLVLTYSPATSLSSRGQSTPSDDWSAASSEEVGDSPRRSRVQSPRQPRIKRLRRRDPVDYRASTSPEAVLEPAPSPSPLSGSDQPVLGPTQPMMRSLLSRSPSFPSFQGSQDLIRVEIPCTAAPTLKKRQRGE